MHDENQQFQLRYTGERFNEHRLPVDVLADLPAFRDLIIAFAREIWHERNQGRVRVPKGFDKSLNLELAGVNEGSAIPALVWDAKSAQKELPAVSSQISQIVEEAYAAVINLFADAANDEFPKALSSEFIRPLNRFGATLRDGEKIEFWERTAASGAVVYLDSQLRRNLITKVRETYHTRYDGWGVLVGNDASPDDSSAIIKVKTEEYGVVSIAVERDRIKSEFDGRLDSLVQFELTVELSRENQLRSVMAVHDVVAIEYPAGWDAIDARLQEIGRLERGWLDGKGVRIDQAVVRKVIYCLVSRPVLVPLVKVFPLEVGGILLEFEHGGWDLSIEFHPSGDAEVYGIEIDGDASIEPTSFPALSNDFLRLIDTYLNP